MDSGIKIKEAESQFTKIKAQLNRLVSSQEEIIEEIHESSQNILTVVSGINLNLKLKVLDKPSPLILRLNYLNSPPLKSTYVYLSYTVKEPSKQQNMVSYYNPTTIIIQASGTEQQRGTFDKHQWLYMTVTSEYDCKI